MEVVRLINSVVLNGRLTSDPQIRYTPNGTPVCDFNLAVKRNYAPTNEQSEDTDFIRCVSIKKTAETIANHVKKGHLIGLEGSIQTRNYDDESGKRVYVTEVFIKQFHFLEKKDTPQTPNRNGHTANR